MCFLEEYFWQIIVTIFLFGFFYFSFQHFKMKKLLLIESEIAILLHVIDLATTNYKNSYFSQKYKDLLSIHDLEPGSPTNSTKTFNVEYNDLLKKSAKEIYTIYLSDNIKKTCLKYFTVHTLLLQIISNLRNH